jgi:pSer/pThr/pTyr-binding forkhead associated (FHA) protein
MPPNGVITRELDRSPLTLSVDRPGQDHFVSTASAILQFLPSGAIVLLPLNRPVILGRETGVSGGADLVDLAGFNALQHGVSRQHCQLRRQGNQLIVTDLGSTNGTYLNGRRLEPGRDVVVVHRDKLILGTLHLIITFSVFDS